MIEPCAVSSAHDDNKQPTPGVPLNPIFAQISHECEHDIPSVADCKFAALMASTVSVHFLIMMNATKIAAPPAGQL